MGRVTRGVPRTRVDLRGTAPVVLTRPDTVVVEEPLEIRVGHRSVTVTMRTPGDDFDLTIGHLVTEGLIGGADDIAQLMHCTDTDADGAPTYNVVDVTLAPGVRLRRAPAVRQSVATSACGICGTQSVGDLLDRTPCAMAADERPLSPADVVDMLAALRSGQQVFDRTGGLHGAALVDAHGELLVVREDVGRHNAVDKVVGWAAREHRLPLHGHVLCVSSRAGFEIVSKAAMAAIPVVVAVSAPSSLAIELAEAAGQTLIAFARESGLSAYAGAHRLVLPPTGQ